MNTNTVFTTMSDSTVVAAVVIIILLYILLLLLPLLLLLLLLLLLFLTIWCYRFISARSIYLTPPLLPPLQTVFPAVVNLPTTPTWTLVALTTTTIFPSPP